MDYARSRMCTAVERHCSLYVTGGMDPSGGSVPPDPNLTGGMEPGMNTNI